MLIEIPQTTVYGSSDLLWDGFSLLKYICHKWLRRLIKTSKCNITLGLN